ncbi:MAG: hypothetical protein O2816_05175 [Planctomycetota bacterium]|nr:hypothetical protein [Planctomycetota bacterium]
MRSLFVLCPAILSGCFSSVDRHHVFASDLSNPRTPQLLVWPADPAGEDFRYLVTTGESVSLDVAPCLSESDPDPLAYGALVVLLPLDPAPALVQRSEALLAQLRAAHPSASYHCIRQPINFAEVVRGRHLLAMLEEYGGGAIHMDRLSMLAWKPTDLLTVRSDPDGEVRWVALETGGPPRELLAGSLDEVLPKQPFFGGLVFVEPRGCPPDLYRDLVEACREHPPALVLRIPTDGWELGDTELTEEALAPLFPLDSILIRSGPTELTMIAQPNEN